MCAPVFIILDIICLSSALPVDSKLGVETFDSKLSTEALSNRFHGKSFSETVFTAESYRMTVGG